ncbi:hypothetical protein [Actinomyces trachealis]|uniref:hypothetical protein n=1 Tax=Actinomyces trachealis TaxID=2763540 RepID=UPI0018C60C83|nr:hypothetical protein [Actinomyces trachealis]
MPTCNVREQVPVSSDDDITIPEILYRIAVQHFQHFRSDAQDIQRLKKCLVERHVVTRHTNDRVFKTASNFLRVHLTAAPGVELAYNCGQIGRRHLQNRSVLLQPFEDVSLLFRSTSQVRQRIPARQAIRVQPLTEGRSIVRILSVR